MWGDFRFLKNLFLFFFFSLVTSPRVMGKIPGSEREAACFLLYIYKIRLKENSSGSSVKFSNFCYFSRLICMLCPVTEDFLGTNPGLVINKYDVRLVAVRPTSKSRML